MDYTSLPPTPGPIDTLSTLSAKPSSHWESVAVRRQNEISSRIPQEFLVSETDAQRDGINLIRTSGILTPREVEIVEASAVSLLKSIHTQQYTSVEVAQAYCKSAALAHQVVSRRIQEAHR